MSRINGLSGLKFIALAFTWGAILQAAFAQAQTTISVPADYSTIQAAINASTNGDTILVAAGNYQENIFFFGKAIHLTSEDGPATTFLDGNQSGSVVSFANGEGANSIIEGFTIINGTGTLAGDDILTGGGIFVGNGGSPSIVGNVITQNTSPTGHGGGIGCFAAVATVTDNSITGNQGGGIYAAATPQTMVIGKNSIDSNFSNEGIDIVGVGNVVIEDNVIFGNGDDGIDVRSANSVAARRNMVMMNNGDGIQLNSCDVCEATDNTVLSGVADGIFARFCGEVTVTGNFVEGRGANGIYIWICDLAFTQRNISGDNAARGGYYRDIVMVTCRNNITTDNGDDGTAIRGSSAVVDGITSIRNGGRGLDSLSNDFLEIRNSIFRGNSGGQIGQTLGGVEPAPEYSNIEGGFPGVGNIDVDPQFVDDDGPDNNRFTIADNDYRLLADSLCIDVGESSAWLCTDVDIDGTPRLTDGLLNGPERVDMGAHEFSNVYLNVVGTGVPGSNVTVETTGTAGLAVEIVVGFESAVDCAEMGPLFVELATATTFGPFTSPLNVQIQLPTIPMGADHYIIQAIAVSDSGAMIGNTSNAVTIPLEVPVSETVPVQTLVAFRGFNVGGDVTSIAESDDVYASFNPGFTLSSAEAPVWLIFEGNAANGQSPTGISFNFEAQANTPNLEHTTELFNVQTQQFEVVDVGTLSLSDATFVANANGDLSRFLQPSGTIMARTGWRPNGFLLLFPWTISVDHAFWQLDN